MKTILKNNLVKAVYIFGRRKRLAERNKFGFF